MKRYNAVCRSICLNCFVYFITSHLITQKEIQIKSKIVLAAWFIQYYKTLAVRNEFNISMAVGHGNETNNFIGASVLTAGFTFPNIQT